MDEKEIQATMERLVHAWATQKNYDAYTEAFKLLSDTLVKFTRLVEAVECIADCHATMVLDSEESATLETVQTEGTC